MKTDRDFNDEAMYDEEKWLRAVAGESTEDDDGLGAARGLWYAFRLMAGAILGCWWLVRTVSALRLGEYEGWFVGSGLLVFAILSFRYLETNYPRNRCTALAVFAACLTLGLAIL